MEDGPKPSGFSKVDEVEVSGGRSLLRTAIALAPLILAHFILFFMSEGADGAIWICVLLVGVGAIVTGVFVVKALRRTKNAVSLALQILIFFAVFIAYASVGVVGGCFAALIGSGSSL